MTTGKASYVSQDKPSSNPCNILPITDHREHKLTKAALAEAKHALERERDILQAVMNGARNFHLAYLNINFDFVHVNETYARTCGYRPEEMIGKNHFALYPHAENEAIFTRVRDTGEPAEYHDKPFEFPNAPERGVTYWDWSLTPVKGTDGLVTGLVFSLFETTEHKRMEEALHESEGRVRLKLESILSPETDIGNLELADIIDSQAIQLLMDDFHQLTQIPIAIIDTKGKILVGVGWQAICTRFHRFHPDTNRICIESDTQLATGIAPGEFKLYKCKNNMWDMATPIMVGERHLGNLFLGQFLLDDEPVDYGLFRNQARQYGFNEDEYISALKRVKNLSRDSLVTAMKYFTKLADMISRLSYSNIKLARSLAERDALTNSLRKSEERYQLATTVANEAIWDLDLVSGRILRNTSYREMFGSPADGETISQHQWWLERVHPEDRQRVMSSFSEALAEGKNLWVCEYRMRAPDGSYVYLTDRAIIVRNSDGTPVRAVGAKLNITDQRLAEEALCRANDELETRVRERTEALEKALEALKEETRERQRVAEALREKDRLLLQQSRMAAMGEMINNIAHQWRQPLNALGLNIQRLPLFYELGDFNGAFLQASCDDAMKLICHMSQTIEDFRNFFKPDKEKLDFNVNRVIQQTINLVDASFRSNNIQLTFQSAGEILINGYPNEFSQVILNILQNARDVLMERHVPDGLVAIASSVENGRAVITIRDNGGGIPPGIIAEIFELYFTTKGSNGTGIGLYMSKNIIENNMGGKMSVRNMEDGAEFRIEV